MKNNKLKNVLNNSFSHSLLKRLKLLFVPPLESFADAPDLFQTYRFLNRHPDLIRQAGGWIYQNKFYPDYLTIGGASHAIFQKAKQYCSGKGIDVGAGFWPLPEATPIDINRGTGKSNNLLDIKENSLDYVFSSHCLEHIENWKDALAKWVGKIRIGGIIFLYLPHPNCAIWHPGSPFVGDGHKWIPTAEVIEEALKAIYCEIVIADPSPDAMQSFYICSKKVS